MLNHHAYLYCVDNPELSSIKGFVRKLNIGEVEYLEIENLGIDDVRTITKKAYVRPALGKELLIVVCSLYISIEAQQAMLKLLEEPPQTTKFLFCLPFTLHLLPTLLSRFQVENDYSQSQKNNLVTFNEFYLKSVKERMAEIANRMLKRDSVWVEEIKTGLLNKLVAELKISSPEDSVQLFWLAKHLQTRGASNKMLLEELALTLR